MFATLMAEFNSWLHRFSQLCELLTFFAFVFLAEAVNMLGDVAEFGLSGCRYFLEVFFVDEAIRRALDLQWGVVIVAVLHLLQDGHVLLTVEAHDKAFATCTASTTSSVEVV